MSIDTSKLRALAEAATPGPWTAFMGGRGSYVYHRPTATEVCAFASYPDAEFIAGVDPAVVLALCDELAALTDRPADEQIAEWQEDVNCDPASVAVPILAALVAERERADKAETRATIAEMRLYCATHVVSLMWKSRRMWMDQAAWFAAKCAWIDRSASEAEDDLAAAAEERLAAVRALHVGKIDPAGQSGLFCFECSGMTYPCNTIQALDGKP